MPRGERQEPQGKTSFKPPRNLEGAEQPRPATRKTEVPRKVPVVHRGEPTKR
jgi:hypothetical protein